MKPINIYAFSRLPSNADKDFINQYLIHITNQKRNEDVKLHEYQSLVTFVNDLIIEFGNQKNENFRKFGKTLNNWRDEILNSFIRVDGRRLSNGSIEGINSIVKTMMKTANGARKFYRLRNRIMYAINKNVPLKNKHK